MRDSDIPYRRIDTRRNRARWLSDLHAATPSDATLIEICSAAYKDTVGAPFDGEFSVRRGCIGNTWVRRGTLVIYATAGTAEVVHLMSHYVHSIVNPELPPHCAEHAAIEERMLRIAHGILAQRA